MMKLKVDMSGDMKRLKALGAFPLQMRKAMEYAQRQALKAMKAEAIDDATYEYRVEPAAVKRAITLQNYAKGGRFVVRGKRLPIHHFTLTPTRRTKKPRMLYGAVKRSSSPKPLGRAFLMKSGNRNIAMARTSDTRFPIRAVLGPSVPQMVEESFTDIEEVAKMAMENAFMERVTSYMNRGKYKSYYLAPYSSSYRPEDTARLREMGFLQNKMKTPPGRRWK